jgi:light-regulated signal transduction histidine kinase (bacteriophytochrome)
MTAARAESDRQRAALQALLQAASHDLRAPLRRARSFAQLLLPRVRAGLDAEATDLCERAVRCAAEGEELLDGLLTLARVTARADPFAPMDCGTALRDAVRALEQGIGDSRAEIRLGSLPVLSGDAAQITDLFTRLLDNALKFRKKDEPPRIAVSAEARGAEWWFSVQDNGIGIAPKDHERIFVVFQRLHGAREYPGIGLGLAVCRSIVERHGGRLWVESAIGQGATFRFTLPRAAGG